MKNYKISIEKKSDFKYCGEADLIYTEQESYLKVTIISPNWDGKSWVIGIKSMQRWTSPERSEIPKEKCELIIFRIKAWGEERNLKFTIDDGSLGKSSHQEMLNKGYTVMTYPDGSIRYIPPISISPGEKEGQSSVTVVDEESPS